MTPPKQMLPQQGPQMMAPRNQMMEPQGLVLLQQNEQQLNPQNQSSVMLRPAQIMRRPSPTSKEKRCNFQDRYQDRCYLTSL